MACSAMRRGSSIFRWFASLQASVDRLTDAGIEALRQRSIQMAQDERAIRLWADHLAFSMIRRGGVYIRTEVRWTVTRCKFTFDDAVWNGFSHGSTWNGFDNVAVTKRKLGADHRAI